MAEPVVNADYRREIERARRELRALMASDINSAPTILCLAYTYASLFSIANSDDASTTCTDDTKPVTDRIPLDPNKSADDDPLYKAVELCEKVKEKYPTITYPDLYQLAGVVAVEVTGGPTIDFVPGRKDLSILPAEGCLPDAKQGLSQFRDFFNRVGLTDRYVLALYGGLKQWESPRTNEPLKFDNSYFKKLKDGPDMPNLEDPPFRNQLELYAKDEEAFFRDYAESHKKLSELRFTPHSSFFESAVRNSTLAVKNIPAAQRAVGVAVAAAVAILSFFYLIHRKTNKNSPHQFH